MQNPRTAGIAAFLRRYYVEHKRVSCGGFIKAAKGKLSHSEAKNVFEYYLDEASTLLPNTKRMFVWNCRQEHFNDIAVGEMLAALNIRDTLITRHYKKLGSPVKNLKKKDEPKLPNLTTEQLVDILKSRGYVVTLTTK